MKKVLLVLLIIIIAIQFIPSQKNIAAGDSPNSITKVYDVPPDVQQILKTSCNDCHSNNTQYPWYNRIQPVAMYLAYHVKDGKRELNFDEFAAYSPEKRLHKIEETREVIQKNEMPLQSYTIIHSDAILSDAQKQTLINWTNSIAPHHHE
ncbi:heme-binding domain-containing protein [Haoranjiania flava]|uniref:Heme-binding domain-containing protein n=1 Tax=Haoranjiania flava TaxID=1856322 RepID=A0AAE3INY1_9BACT|nr:heme-binding domain-containing protein [Haoranjiania flava]MCU7693781.1 heme-binding domain-containing protein [Haoranjiania flava]